MFANGPRLVTSRRLVLCVFALISGEATQTATAQPTGASPVFNVRAANERLELIVNSSRLLTLDERVPQAQVNNPDILDLTPLSANQIQVFAKKPGVTQVNLWTENEQIYTIDVIVFGDARELEMLLRTEFPNASLRAIPLPTSVIISGYVDHPEQVSRIIAIAEDYHPKVINNIQVGGVQQVLLQVKVMEVSRTKLRRIGFEFSNVSDVTDFASFGSTAVLDVFGNVVAPISETTRRLVSDGHTFTFGLVDSSNAFLGVLEALRENGLAKVLAEPNLVTMSGRPASFNSGGEFPILVPQSLGTVSISYKKFGTQIDFVPLVLGNGNIRLEVRPRVSEPDQALGVTTQGISVPALRVREVDAGVEMKAGQTLAIAGLVQTRIESRSSGLPWVSELPFIGAAFRKVEDELNEVELLILVTPQLVEAMDPHEVPPGGPGTNSCEPGDIDLYWKGHIEVPCCGGVGCPNCQGGEYAAPVESIPTGSEMIIEQDAGSRGNDSSVERLPSIGTQRRAARRQPARLTRQPTSPAVRAVPARENLYDRADPQRRRVNSTPVKANGKPKFIGSVGYDVEPYR